MQHCLTYWSQARLHVADDDAAAGLQSLANLLTRVQRAASHAQRQGHAQLKSLNNHESEVGPACHFSEQRRTLKAVAVNKCQI